MNKYPALKLGFDVLRHGGLAGTAFNAAKEALNNFLSLNLKFNQMADVVSATMDQLLSENTLDGVIDIEAVIEIDKYARLLARKNSGYMRFKVGNFLDYLSF